MILIGSYKLLLLWTPRQALSFPDLAGCVNSGGESLGVANEAALGSSIMCRGTGSAVCGGACPAPQTGTGTKKKGASPQLYPKNVAKNIPSHVLRQIKKEIDDEKDKSS
jgi:hypothetical protein